MMAGAGLRVKAYRGLARAFSAAFDRRGPSLASTPVPTSLAGNGTRIWFHAASAGELESLASVAELWAHQGGELVLSVFSPSGKAPLEQLSRRIAESGRGSVAASGFSPPEGGWREALLRLKPSAFVTAKYEAWPELWAALAELGIPLIVVGAMDRRSLRSCAKLTRVLGAELPRILFIAADPADEAALRREFPRSETVVEGEPRWDRVAERMNAGNPRARQLLERFSERPRPWVVLGSVWPEDLRFWGAALRDLPGTLWCVPHRIDPAHVEEIEALLREAGMEPFVRSSADDRSAATAGVERRGILVDEMGFLLELYTGADAAYVGGGFGAGVHSTLEPAMAGIPVAAGPRNAHRFPEVGQLGRAGQLEILGSRAQAREWARKLQGIRPEDRERWKSAAAARIGVSARVLERIRRAAGLT